MLRPLVFAGGLTFGASYALSFVAAFAGTAEGNGGAAALFIPVVGPLITIGTVHADAGGSLVLVFDTLVQGAGGTLLIYGLTARERYLQRAAASPLFQPDVVAGLRSAGLRWRF
jgi:hypothetical protein